MLSSEAMRSALSLKLYTSFRSRITTITASSTAFSLAIFFSRFDRSTSLFFISIVFIRNSLYRSCKLSLPFFFLSNCCNAISLTLLCIPSRSASPYTTSSQTSFFSSSSCIYHSIEVASHTLQHSSINCLIFVMYKLSRMFVVLGNSFWFTNNCAC